MNLSSAAILSWCGCFLSWVLFSVLSGYTRSEKKYFVLYSNSLTVMRPVAVAHILQLNQFPRINAAFMTSVFSYQIWLPRFASVPVLPWWLLIYFCCVIHDPAPNTLIIVPEKFCSVILAKQVLQIQSILGS